MALHPPTLYCPGAMRRWIGMAIAGGILCLAPLMLNPDAVKLAATRGAESGEARATVAATAHGSRTAAGCQRGEANPSEKDERA